MEINIFVDNIEMSKRSLREYLGVQSISQAKKVLGVPHYSTSKTYRLLDDLCSAERGAAVQRETQKRNNCFYIHSKLKKIN